MKADGTYTYQESFNGNMARCDKEIEAGFKSEAARQRAYSENRNAFEIVVDEIRDMILANGVDGLPQAHHDLYWFSADVRNWAKNEHRYLTIIGEGCSELCEVATQLAEKAKLIKAMPVNAPAPKADTVEAKAEVQVLKSITKMMEERSEKYNRCLRLDEVFGTMGITANVHMVHGHKGTVFPRAFFYVLGVITPLSTIIAAMEESKRRELTNC